LSTHPLNEDRIEKVRSFVAMAGDAREVSLKRLPEWLHFK